MPFNLPDIPVLVTLTYADGRTVTVDVQGHGGNPPMRGIVWGSTVEQLKETRRMEAEVVDDPAAETAGWLNKEPVASPMAKVCWIENGQVKCTPP